MADRRTSPALAAPAPPAPPLPPPKQKRSYLERLLAQPLTAYGARPPSSQTSRADGPPNPLVPKLPGYVRSPSPHAGCIQCLYLFIYQTSISAACWPCCCCCCCCCWHQHHRRRTAHGACLLHSPPAMYPSVSPPRAFHLLSLSLQRPHRLLPGCKPQDRPGHLRPGHQP